MKKFLVLFLSLVLTLSASLALVGCGGDKTVTDYDLTDIAGTYDITVWVSESTGVKELTEQQIARYNAENEFGIVFNPTVVGVSESESATQMITSVEDGADLFCFAQDQTMRLVQAGALTKLGENSRKAITSRNDAGSVGAATVGDNMYCYPLTSDNGYFMYYDKSVLKGVDLTSLEAIIAKCEEKGYLFSYELEGSAWYNAGFFFATGCVSEWTTADDGSFVSVNDTFNSDAGLIALKGMQKVLKSSAYNNSSAGKDFGAATPSAVVISGTWDSATVKGILGDNYGVAELPSFTVEVEKENGETEEKTYHLGSFSGNKLLGIKPQVDAKRAAVLQQLAVYLTSDDCQLERFEEFGWGPSNIKAQQNKRVQADPALAALAAQGNYAKPQGQIQGSWWDIGKTYAVKAKAADLNDDAALTAALSEYKAAIDAVLSIPTEVKEAFTVIGAICGSKWDKDFTMTQKPAGTWTSDLLELKAGDELKVRQGLSWDVAFGDNGENYKVAEDGFYFVKLVYNKEEGTGVVTLETESSTYGWGVVGSFEGGSWENDIYMSVQKDGSWLSPVITFNAAKDENGKDKYTNEFKVRQGSSWTVNYGADGEFNGSNIKVETLGKYQVKLVIDGDVATITLIPVQE